MTGIPLRAPAFWWREPGAVSALLSPVAAIYGNIAARRLTQPGYRAAMRVICVGNPTVGGTGKTPAAIAIGKLLRGKNKRVVFLTRGYGGSLAGPVLVEPDKHSAREVGDEALLLAGTAPTIVSRNRAEGAKLAEEMKADVLVLDDGFQNPSLEKDVSILVVDGIRGLGNHRVFPAGPLRAELAPQFARAQAMLVIGAGEAGDDAAGQASDAGLELLDARIVPDAVAVAALSGMRVFAFAGIGAPEKFYATLGIVGARVVERRSFPDHHRYTLPEAGELISAAAAKNLILVTTEKDRARMTGDPNLAVLRERAVTLPVTLAFDDEAGLSRIIGI